jgi:hypothetical protein
MTLPENNLEFQLQWSSNAGKLAAMKEALVEIENRAGEAFVRRKDAVATALRDLATEIKSHISGLEKTIDAFVKEDASRRYQVKKMVG